MLGRQHSIWLGSQRLWRHTICQNCHWNYSPSVHSGQTYIRPEQRKKHSTCLAKVGAMCGIPLSVLSLVTGQAISLHGNSCLAASARLNSRSTLLLNHLVIMCKHCLHYAFLRAVCCPVAHFTADEAAPRESATLILLRPTRIALALKI